MKVKVRCPGKVILFGEHASVYGHPSLVATVGAYTEVHIEQIIEPHIRYEAPDFDYKHDCKISLLDGVVAITDEESEKEACQQIRHILTLKQSVTEDSWFLLLYYYHKILPVKGRFGIRVTATTRLWPGSGLGSSASYCSSLALALLTLSNQDTSTENINRISYEGEKVFHGTPSGVDNTACTYGGCLLYRKGGVPPFTRITLNAPPRLLLVNSKQEHNTAAIVREVAQHKDKIQETLARIGEISLAGQENLALGRDIGHLMTENHNLLNKLPGVSSHHTDTIVDICNGFGVPAKITGAGGGGVVIGLIRDCVDVLSLKNTLKRQGYQVLDNVEIGVDGVQAVLE